jgi:mRNA interferase MazF
MSNWNRGEIWLLDLDPTLGSEINKTRPAIIVSRSDYNKIAETVTVIPISSGRFIPSFHTRLSKLKKESHAVIPQVRIATKKRFIKKIGDATKKELDEINGKLGFYLDLL